MMGNFPMSNSKAVRAAPLVKAGRLSKRLRRLGLLARRAQRGILALLLIGTLVFIALKLPLSQVTRVRVEGTHQIDAVEVAEASELWGKNIFLIYLLGPGGRPLPTVKRTSLSITLPGEVILRVTERQPWALWQAKNAQYVIDEEGIIIARASAAKQLPTIVETGERNLRLGERVDPGVVHLAQTLAQRLPAELGVSPQRYEYARSTGLTIATDKGWRVRIGDGEDLDYKLAALKAILEGTATLKKRVELVDVRFLDRPYFR